jgi:hypothetical protein
VISVRVSQKGRGKTEKLIVLLWVLCCCSL